MNNFQGAISNGLQNLTSLKHLALNSNNFNSSMPNWLFKFNHLEYICLYNNSFQGTISDGIGNLTSLRWLNISYNSLVGRISRSMARLRNLRLISLSGVKLNQDVSEIFETFSGCVSNELEKVFLRYYSIFGHLTDQLGQFKNLQTLVLDVNSISGPLPLSLGQLSSLRIIDLGYNKSNGTVSQIHLTNLTRLSFFSLCDNTMTLKLSHDWIPPFQLHVLGLRSCYVGSRFPSWIHSQKHLIYLDLSNSGLSNTIPRKFWKSNFQFVVIDLSQNHIHGEIPNLTNAHQLQLLTLSSNNFSGPLPLISSSVIALDLSNNTYSGSVSNFLCHRINELNKMQVLFLEHNSLHGQIPDCWMNHQYLLLLSLSNNKFTGNLPVSLGTLSSLQPLHLRNNNLSGMIPESLKNCTALVTLDLGENEFVGNIPTWIDERFSRMIILILRSNKFYGSLPAKLCNLALLHVLDLANNNFSGTTPRCINDFSAMATMGNWIGNAIQYPPLLICSNQRFLSPNILQVIEDASLVMKGKIDLYDKILNLVRIIDISYNAFSGEIPVKITDLKALQTLNLSHNFFAGKIPKNIGSIRSLEFIDFSLNQLSGEIPPSISSLTFLSHLNLSNNNLSGKFPENTKLQGLDANCFVGNDLCGSPLPKHCSENPEDKDEDADANEDEDEWFNASMALGFVVGLLSTICPLLVNRKWRCMY